MARRLSPKETAVREASMQLSRKCVELHISGLTYRQIAEKLGIAGGASTVTNAIHRALRTVPAPAVEQMRQIDGERLEGIIQAHWKKRGDAESARIIIHALERHAKLFGLDAPVKTEITGQNGGPIEMRDASVAYDTILERLARLADAASSQPTIDVTADAVPAVPELVPSIRSTRSSKPSSERQRAPPA